MNKSYLIKDVDELNVGELYNIETINSTDNYKYYYRGHNENIYKFDNGSKFIWIINIKPFYDYETNKVMFFEDVNANIKYNVYKLI